MALSQFGLGVGGVAPIYEQPTDTLPKQESNKDQYLVYPPDDGTDKKINPYGQH